MTWADLAVADLASNLKLYNEEGIKNAAKDCDVIKAHIKGILELPKIKAWIEKRPKTEM